MPKNFRRIAELGFQKVGYWQLVGDQLDFHINHETREEKNVLYAFVSNGSLAYIGKTTQPIKDRLQRYKTPAKNSLKGGSTNIKNHLNIRANLSGGAVVEIYVYFSKEKNLLGGFSVNMAAALEDGLISELRPPWNGRSAPLKIESFVVAGPPKLQPPEKFPRRLSAEEFRGVLKHKLKEAEMLGLGHIDIVSGSLHREIGGYPGRNHAMPVCCSVMRGEMKGKDEVLAAPPKGRGASLHIRYFLPR